MCDIDDVSVWTDDASCVKVCDVGVEVLKVQVEAERFHLLHEIMTVNSWRSVNVDVLMCVRRWIGVGVDVGMVGSESQHAWHDY